MIDQVQETDTRIIFSSPTKAEVPLPRQTPETTSGTNLYKNFPLLGAEPDFLKSAWELTESFSDKQMAREAAGLLSIIQEMVATFRVFRFEIGSMPKLNAVTAADGSLLFEWITEDFRLGFNIEPNPQESSWFLATSRNLGRINAYGFISGVDLSKTILWLLNFVITNSQA